MVHLGIRGLTDKTGFFLYFPAFQIDPCIGPSDYLFSLFRAYFPVCLPILPHVGSMTIFTVVLVISIVRLSATRAGSCHNMPDIKIGLDVDLYDIARFFSKVSVGKDNDC